MGEKTTNLPRLTFRRTIFQQVSNRKLPPTNTSLKMCNHFQEPLTWLIKPRTRLIKPQTWFILLQTRLMELH